MHAKYERAAGAWLVGISVQFNFLRKFAAEKTGFPSK